jgi:hypothetical protein
MSPMICPNCRESTLVEIRLTVSLHEVVLRSCSACESRWWHRDGEGSTVNEVMELAAQTKR